MVQLHVVLVLYTNKSLLINTSLPFFLVLFAEDSYPELSVQIDKMKVTLVAFMVLNWCSR